MKAPMNSTTKYHLGHKLFALVKKLFTQRNSLRESLQESLAILNELSNKSILNKFCEQQRSRVPGRWKAKIRERKLWNKHLIAPTERTHRLPKQTRSKLNKWQQNSVRYQSKFSNVLARALFDLWNLRRSFLKNNNQESLSVTALMTIIFNRFRLRFQFRNFLKTTEQSKQVFVGHSEIWSGTELVRLTGYRKNFPWRNLTPGHYPISKSLDQKFWFKTNFF